VGAEPDSATGSDSAAWRGSPRDSALVGGLCSFACVSGLAFRRDPISARRPLVVPSLERSGGRRGFAMGIAGGSVAAPTSPRSGSSGGGSGARSSEGSSARAATAAATVAALRAASGQLTLMSFTP